MNQIRLNSKNLFELVVSIEETRSREVGDTTVPKEGDSKVSLFVNIVKKDSFERSGYIDIKKPQQIDGKEIFEWKATLNFEIPNDVTLHKEFKKEWEKIVKRVSQVTIEMYFDGKTKEELNEWMTMIARRNRMYYRVD